MTSLPSSITFPYFSSGNHKITSPQTPKYNCIAWAAGDDGHWWWPAPGFYWPNGIPRQETIDVFLEAFASLGYEVCNGLDIEHGFEKVALYALNGKPTHMARQLNNGTWASKLGKSYDIEHMTPNTVEGTLYGQSILFMKRRVTGHEE